MPGSFVHIFVLTRNILNASSPNEDSNVSRGMKVKCFPSEENVPNLEGQPKV